MQWDDSPNAGFTDGTPWIQVADSYKTVNVKSTLEDPDSIFVHYQKLIQMRKTLPVVQEGVYIPMLRDHPKVYAYERKTDDDSLIVVSNFFPEETAADVCLDGYEVYLSNYSDSKAENHLVLRPYESVIFRKKA
jgi:trehalose-6-phosphate hydrolase